MIGRDALCEVLDAVRITGNLEIFWFDQSVDTIRPLPESMIREALVSFVGRLLYRAWYVYGRPRRDLDLVSSDSEARPPSRSPHFIRAVLAANAGADFYTAAYPIHKSTSGDSVLVSGVRVQSPHLPTIASGADRVELDISGVSLTKSPGYVMFTSRDGPPARADDDPLMRVYWNVSRDGAIALTEQLSAHLAGQGIQYQYKVLHADRDWPERADTAVFYVAKSGLLAAWDQLASIRARLRPMLRPYTPALTRTIATGVALAEDPGGGDSFGTYVCRILAVEIVDEFRRTGGSTRSIRSKALYAFDVVEQLGPRGHAHQVIEKLPGLAEPRSVSETPSPERRSDWLAKADELAHDVTRRALWQGERCTWLGPDDTVRAERGIRAIGANLYQGTAGIGLMLAQLHAHTADGEHRRCARGATLQSLAAARDIPSAGLYTGRSGVGLAAALSGHLLDDADLCHAGADMVRDAALTQLATRTEHQPFDLVDGLAGLILSLIALDSLDDSNCLDLASVIAERLLRQALESDGNLHWLDASRQDEVAFTGLAHGVSGCVLALARLATATREMAWADAAVRACRYERSWFDPQESNWQDARVWLEGGGRLFSGRTHGLFRFDWCYGAPGILLARLGVYEHAGNDPEIADDLRAALQQSRRAARQFPALGHATGLCHGAGGLAEVLSLVPSELADPNDITGISQLSEIVVAASKSASVVDDPGLMMGTAGAVCLALRRYSPDVLSPVLPGFNGSLKQAKPALGRKPK